MEQLFPLYWAIKQKSNYTMRNGAMIMDKARVYGRRFSEDRASYNWSIEQLSSIQKVHTYVRMYVCS